MYAVDDAELRDTPCASHCSFNRGWCSHGEVGGLEFPHGASGWNNLANETNVSNARVRSSSKSPGCVSCHKNGSIWVFKGHAKFYFRISDCCFAFLEVCRRVVRARRGKREGLGHVVSGEISKTTRMTRNKLLKECLNLAECRRFYPKSKSRVSQFFCLHNDSPIFDASSASRWIYFYLQFFFFSLFSSLCITNVSHL